MASLILVLREGAIKQAARHARRGRRDQADAQPRRRRPQRASLDRTRPPGRSTPRSAARPGRAARRARPPGRRADRPHRCAIRRRAVEEVFSDGLLNVMEAPEFAQSDKLRRVFTALENRAYLGELVGSVAGSGAVQVFIGAENAPPEMQRRVARPRPVRPAGPAIGVVGVLGPDPDELSPGDRHGPLRVRAHERTRGPPVLYDDAMMTTRATAPPSARARRRRVERRAEEAPRRDLDTSLGRARCCPPTCRGAALDAATASRSSKRQAERDEYLAALQRERAEFLNFKRRTAEERERDARSRGRGPHPQGPRPGRRLRPGHRAPAGAIADDAWVEGIAAIDRKLRRCSRARA